MISLQDKKQIRGLMQDPKWGAFEFVFQDYLKENFLNISAKQDTEFNTIWFIAHNDGGKYHLNNFINQLNQHAQYD